MKLENVDYNLLRKAIGLVAEKLGVSVQEKGMVQGAGFTEPVDFLFNIRTRFGSGIGVRVDGEKVRIIADTHDVEDLKLVENIESLITQAYTGLAAAESLAELGYTNIRLNWEGNELVVVAEGGGI